MNTTKQVTNINRKYHNSLASRYDSYQERYHPKVLDFNNMLIRKALYNFKRKKKLHILDIGCGTGYLEQFLDPNIHAIDGIDVSSKMINIAKKKFPKVNYSLRDVNDLSKSRTYDMIVGNAVLHHFKSYRDVIEKSSKLLGSHGCMLFGTEPNYYSYHYLSIFKKAMRIGLFDKRQLKKTNVSKFEQFVEYHVYQSEGINPFELRKYFYALGFHHVTLHFSSREFFASLIDRMGLPIINVIPNILLDSTYLLSRNFAIIAYK